MPERLHYHIMGVGGAGMSAIAHLLLDQGALVSGCDMQANMLTAELEARGATIGHGHDPSHLEAVDTLVISSAVRPGNPEIEAAASQSLPVLKRSDLWREWSCRKPTLAIAGTHGKTTTTAMAALVLSSLGHDPAYIVPAGGPVPGLERFARWGAGPLVIEADEYDRLLLGLVPEVAVITSVDWDHVDIYPSQAAVDQTFEEFAGQVRRLVVICDDDPGARRLRRRLDDQRAAWQSYGFAPEATWRIADVGVDGQWTHFKLYGPVEGQDGPMPFQGRLQVPGAHNLLNAVAVVASLAQFGVAPENALRALADFQGASRRFEWKGEEQGIAFVDDYAHNPAKVAATLAAARMRYRDRRLVVYFQPHTFSRTAALLDPLAQSLQGADVVLVGDIYPSRERAEDFPGVDARLLAERVGDNAVAAGDLRAAAVKLLARVRPGDLVITMGAGDGYRVGDEVRARLGSGASREP